MPNHVHVVVQPHIGYELAAIVHSWKSFSSNRANESLRRKGAFWRTEYYDHLIRDESDREHAVSYVLTNPVKARLRDWAWVGSVDGRLAAD